MTRVYLVVGTTYNRVNSKEWIAKAFYDYDKAASFCKTLNGVRAKHKIINEFDHPTLCQELYDAGDVNIVYINDGGLFYEIVGLDVE